MNGSRTDPLCCAAHPHAIYAGPDGPREPGFSEHRDLGKGSLLWLISQLNKDMVRFASAEAIRRHRHYGITIGPRNQDDDTEYQ